MQVNRFFGDYSHFSIRFRGFGVVSAGENP